MRELKFRAYNKYGMSVPFTLLAISTYKPVCGTVIHERSWPDETEFMQFTGLKDKNGKEIYEGDIVKWKDLITGEVKWQQQACGYHINWQDGKISRYHELTANWGAEDYGNDHIEVVGNIHENAELLATQPPLRD